MISKDMIGYLNTNHSDCLKTWQVISQYTDRYGKIKYMLTSGKKAFSFDDITKKIFSGLDQPASADVLYKDGKSISFVELKTGFRDKITTENYDPEKMSCPDDKSKECVSYKKIFFEKRDLQKQELIENIKLKAIESFVTLEKKILPCCANSNGTKIHFIAVIDAGGEDDMEESLTDLVNEKSKGKPANKDNPIESVRQALKRLSSYCDNAGGKYYYDEIEVCSFQEFSQRLK